MTAGKPDIGPARRPPVWSRFPLGCRSMLHPSSTSLLRGSEKIRILRSLVCALRRRVNSSNEALFKSWLDTIKKLIAGINRRFHLANVIASLKSIMADGCTIITFYTFTTWAKDYARKARKLIFAKRIPAVVSEPSKLKPGGFTGPKRPPCGLFRGFGSAAATTGSGEPPGEPPKNLRGSPLARWLPKVHPAGRPRFMASFRSMASLRSPRAGTWFFAAWLFSRIC